MNPKHRDEILVLWARISDRACGKNNGAVPRDIENYVQTRIRRDRRARKILRKGGKPK